MGNKNSGRKPNELPIRHTLGRMLDEVDPSTGRKRLVDMCETLLTQAIAGDMAAIREVNDRVEGKAKQVNEHGGIGGGPMKLVLETVVVKPE